LPTETEEVDEVEETQDPVTADFDVIDDFTFNDYNGDPVSLSDFPDTLRVVNSWAAWCPFCIKELPDFAQLQQEYPDEIVVIAIDRAEPLRRAKRFSDDKGVTGKIVLLLDPADKFYRQIIGGIGMPETIFVDADNNILVHKRGVITLEEMREIVEEILE